MKIAHIVEELSELLSDNDEQCPNTRWSKKLLEHWALEGYLLASTVAKHKNTDIIEIELVEGSVQTLPDGYEEFVRVVNNIGTLSLIEDSADKSNAVDRFSGIYESDKDCDAPKGMTLGVKQLGEGDYVIEGWESEQLSANTFYVNPPVPKGFKGSVRVLATKTIDINNIDEVPMWVHALCIDWGLHRALSTDIESEHSYQRSQASRENFYKLLALYAIPQAATQVRGNTGEAR